MLNKFITVIAVIVMAMAMPLPLFAAGIPPGGGTANVIGGSAPTYGGYAPTTGGTITANPVNTNTATGGNPTGGSAVSTAKGGAGGTVVNTVSPVNTNSPNNATQSRSSFTNNSVVRFPVAVPQPVAPQVPGTPFFGRMNQLTAIAKGIPADVLYLNACNTTATQKHMLKDVFAKGASNKTMVVWSPSQDYYTHGAVSVGGKRIAGKPKQYKSFSHKNGGKTQTARASFPSKAGKYECLGLMIVQASGGNQIPLSTVASDGRIYALQHLNGFKDIELISARSLIASANGVKSAGSGFSIAPGLVAMATTALSAGALTGGYTNGGANTGIATQVGITFFVVSKAQKGGGVLIDPEQLK